MTSDRFHFPCYPAFAFIFLRFFLKLFWLMKMCKKSFVSALTPLTSTDFWSIRFWTWAVAPSLDICWFLVSPVKVCCPPVGSAQVRLDGRSDSRHPPADCRHQVWKREYWSGDVGDEWRSEVWGFLLWCIWCCWAEKPACLGFLLFHSYSLSLLPFCRFSRNVRQADCFQSRVAPADLLTCWTSAHLLNWAPASQNNHRPWKSSDPGFHSTLQGSNLHCCSIVLHPWGGILHPRSNICDAADHLHACAPQSFLFSFCSTQPVGFLRLSSAPTHNRPRSFTRGYAD